MTTISTTMPIKRKKQPKKEHPTITKGKAALKPRKNPKPIIKKLKQEKPAPIIVEKCVVQGRWRDTDTGEMKDATDLFLNRLALAGIQWSKKPDAIILSQFYNSVGICKQTFNEFADKNDRLRAARRIMHENIADNRERGAIVGAYSPSAVIPFQGLRSKEFKEHMKWKAELTKDINNGDQKVIVQIESIVPIIESSKK